MSMAESPGAGLAFVQEPVRIGNHQASLVTTVSSKVGGWAFLDRGNQ